MKKTFLARRNALFSSTDLSWGAYALIGASFLLLVRLIAPDFFWRTFTPVFRIADSFAAGSHTLFSSFGDTTALALENEKLYAENTALRLENRALFENLETVSSFKRLIRGIPASVVARPPENPYDMLILGSGARDGISAGMSVFALPSGEARDEVSTSGVPIGIISSVTEDFSRATLFSSPGVSTSGWIGAMNLPLSLMGLGAGAMRATLPRATPVAISDVVYAPGPGALPIGRVARIDQDPSSPSLILHITSAVNLFSLTWVLVRDTGTTLP